MPLCTSKIFNLDDKPIYNRKVNNIYISFQVSKSWNILALDGSSWQKINLFDFQTDIEVNINLNFDTYLYIYFFKGCCYRKHFPQMWWISQNIDT